MARTWTRGPLPFSGLNAAYLRYVQHGASTWALGTLIGNYEKFSIEPDIRRTANYESCETIAGHSRTLPRLIFYASAAFQGAMWMLGGHDGVRVFMTGGKYSKEERGETVFTSLQRRLAASAPPALKDHPPASYGVRSCFLHD